MMFLECLSRPTPTTTKLRDSKYLITRTSIIAGLWAIVAATYFGFLDPHLGLGTRLILLSSQRIPLITPQLIQDLEALNEHRRNFDFVNFKLGFGPQMRSTVDVSIPSREANRTIPVRLYYPTTSNITEPHGLLPILMWIHGGGWCLGSINSDDAIARRVAHATGALVVSVEYRLAPEHKWPAQLDDVVDAINFIKANGTYYGGDTERMGVAGESAGGQLTLTSVLSLSPEQRSGLCGIMPVAPAILAHKEECPTSSCDAYANGYLLTRENILLFWNAYLGEEEGDHHLISPLKATEEHLESFPPMLMMIAGRDPLRDEAEAFYHKVAQAGVQADKVVYERTVHGFFGRKLMTHANDGVDSLASWYREKCILTRSMRIYDTPAYVA